MSMHQALLAAGGVAGSVYILEKSAADNRFPSISFTTSSTSYVDCVYNGTNTVHVTLTISSGSAVWICGTVIGSNTGTNFSCGVNADDGVNPSTDYDIGRVYNNTATFYAPATGDILITGLSAGTYTFTLRTKIVGGTLTVGSTVGFFCLRATEVKTSLVKVSNRANAGSYSINAATLSDLLDQAAGNTYATGNFTKLSGTELLAFCNASCVNTTGNTTQVIYGSDGAGTDVILGRNRSFSSGARVIVAGANAITGIAAGTRNMKARVQSTGSNGNVWQDGTANRHLSSFTVIETGVGAFNAAVTSLSPASNVGVTATSYTNLLDASGGSPVTRSFTKEQASTKLLIRAMLHGVGSGNLVITLGVNDGATDHDIVRTQVGTTPQGCLTGEREISGLAAGAYTITARVKVNTGTFTFNAGTNSVSLSVIEVAS